MVRYGLCETCNSTGRVWVVDAFAGDEYRELRHTEECPDCQGSGYVTTLGPIERLVPPSVRVRYSQVRRKARSARQMWRDRNADVVAAVVHVDKGALADEPQVRSLVDRNLAEQVRALTPLGWRLADLCWCWQNAKRAVRGRPMLSPHEERVTVEVRQDGVERNLAAILAERRRVGRG